MGYGMRSITIRPSFSATKPSLRLAVEIGMFSPRPTVLWPVERGIGHLHHDFLAAIPDEEVDAPRVSPDSIRSRP